MWADLSAADVVRRIYHHLAADGWSCMRIADRVQLAGCAHLLQTRWSRCQGQTHPGRLALGPHPQPRRQYRLHGLTPVRPQVFQTQWPVRHLRFRPCSSLRGRLERSHLHPQAQPRHPQELSPLLPPPLPHPLRRLRPLLLRYLVQRLSLQMQRSHGRTRPSPG